MQHFTSSVADASVQRMEQPVHFQRKLWTEPSICSGLWCQMEGSGNKIKSTL